ncbi:hypothetical protein GCM10010406_21120 [Streptomyces thermolineatus]|uniref:Uncharacterized protein n=1 Tax=Streptomyces thermolineatus TaxID=44033 RepID=A0ABN3LI06_9ACTN
MAEEKTTTRTRKTPDDGVAQEIQRVTDEASEQGFFGVAVDPTPNENYTVAGVTQGAPTPETDEKTAAEARRASFGR